eukprot:CAMPEP_0197827582 /NCGR_PEP_ID=MMETSP1437-20131217/4332_1 /TAXON_ID=49252 ORGANISM="Eucampia antarctica, Strain CCMP1452" /NCGR_SAMPLE_ID=MMETSP1437 /ASSEMBLY_ACC=CAM_ASM_001096 /LENGTH=84 /DNA_ID=CAMNT_0043428483 /DNA_START=77 /DNA_END=328 /DNA_ORIENTATION=+
MTMMIHFSLLSATIFWKKTACALVHAILDQVTLNDSPPMNDLAFMAFGPTNGGNINSGSNNNNNNITKQQLLKQQQHLLNNNNS